MKIAAIDYGQHIGLAIADFDGNNLQRVLLGTYYDADEKVAQFVIGHDCRWVVMEDPPYLELGGSAGSFYRMFEILKKFGYDSPDAPKSLEDLSSEKKSIIRYLPGVWKPLVHSIKPDFSVWNPKTAHEKDAMGILWYALRAILEKEPRYA